MTRKFVLDPLAKRPHTVLTPAHNHPKNIQGPFYKQ